LPLYNTRFFLFKGEYAGGTMEKNIANIDMAKLIFSALNTRELSDFEMCLAENAVLDFPGAGCLEGKKRILIFFKVLFRKYKRLEFTVKEIIIEGDRACVVWNNEGDDTIGRPYKNRGVTLVKMSQGKITLISDYFKDTSFVSSG